MLLMSMTRQGSIPGGTIHEFSRSVGSLLHTLMNGHPTDLERHVAIMPFEPAPGTTSFEENTVKLAI